MPNHGGLGTRRVAHRLLGSLLGGLLVAATPGAAGLSTPSNSTPAHGTVPSGTRQTRPTAGLPFDPAPLAGRCGDPAGAWLNTTWRGELRWQFNVGSIPGYLVEVPPETTPDDGPVCGPWPVLAAARSAATTVATGRNDCDLPEDLALPQRYTGDTDRTAGVASDGSCGDRDGHNVVSFGNLTTGLLAVTCIWWDGHPGASHSVEADILVDSNGGTFFLARPADCQSRSDLEGILTHEFGHVFGLGHVPNAEHSTLTMTDGLPECSTTYRSLGLGDYLTLRGHADTRTHPAA